MNCGNFGAIDTTRRLQVARWIWRGEPPVAPSDPGSGVPGRNGARQATYGIGQSLVMVPFDAAMSGALLPCLAGLGLSPEKQQQLAELLIAFFMQSFITAAILLLAYQVLASFGFSSFVNAAGALALLFATSCLQYVQCAQENNLLLLLALCALLSVRRWLAKGSMRWPALAGLACGFAILVRLPSVLETLAIALFALAGGGSRRRFLAAFLPPVLAALVFDRWYHWYRFGEFFSTYIGIFGRQNANAPPGFPFSYPFAAGFFGTLFSPDKSIFLFDPLLLLVLFAAGWNWRGISRELRILLGCLTLLLALYTVFYATYYDFGGDVAWGHRFVTLPVHLLSMFAVPLLLAASLPAPVRWTAWLLVAASVVIQVSSTAIAPNVEYIQKQTGYGHAVLWNRAVNLVEFASGDTGTERFRGIPKEWRTWNYLPFQLRFRFPRLARWAIAGWFGLLLCLPLLVYITLGKACKHDEARLVRATACLP